MPISSIPLKGPGLDLYRSVVDAAPLAMAVLRDGQCVLANKAFGQLHGCAGTACGNHCDVSQFLSLEQGTGWQAIKVCLDQAGEVRQQIQFRDKAGRTEEAEIILRPLPVCAEGHILLTVREVGEEVRMRRLVSHLAFHDSLTELPNRALFFDRLSQALARSRRDDWGFALMIVDLDGFKEINDTLGHGAGDEVLHAVGRRLTGCVRESDTVARLGGDEFALLLHGVHSEVEAAAVAGKVLSRLGMPFPLGAGHPHLGASIGIALCPEHGSTLDSLLTRADRAMYRAKQEGKNRLAMADRTSEELSSPLRMPWVSPLTLGHVELDTQHLGLVQALNAIITAMADGHEKPLLDQLLSRLEQEARAHFKHEEALMATCLAEGMAAHRQAHRISHERMLAELPLLAAQIWSGAFTTTVQALQKWLLDHLRRDDQELALHLNNDIRV